MSYNLRESQRKAEKFEQELERRVKRFQPREFATIMASAIPKVLDNTRLFRGFPPHWIMHSIEANCAYHKPYSDDHLTAKKIRQIVYVYNQYTDPYVDYTLREEQNLILALVALAQEQFPFQMRPMMLQYARYLVLFVGDNLMPEIEGLFIDKYGLSIRDWLYMSFAVLAATNRQNRVVANSQFVTVDTFLDSDVTTVPREAVEPFLKAVSLTVDEIGDRYRTQREEIPSHLHIFIKSTFLEYPLIDFEDGNYLIVHRGILIHYLCEKLFSNCADLDEREFLTKFGSSFEKHVLKVLKEMPHVRNIYDESELQAVSPGKSCDYAIEFDDCILLVESKATRYSARLLTKKAIEGDNSTGKIAEAYSQILAIAERIRQGSLDKLFGQESRSIYGICVAFGQIRAVNAPEYVGYITERMSGQAPIQEKWFSPLESAPQTMWIDTFERFTRVLQCAKLSPRTLIEEKEKRNYHIEAGDWDAFVPNYATDADIEIDGWELPFLREATEDWFKEMLPGYDDSRETN